MPEESATPGWRAGLWRLLLERLPVRVTVDFRAGAYRVRDSSNLCLYADDLNREDYEEIIAEWADALFPGDRAAFRLAFCLKRIQKDPARAERGLCFFASSTSSGLSEIPLCVRATVLRAGEAPRIEFYFARGL